MRPVITRALVATAIAALMLLLCAATPWAAARLPAASVSGEAVLHAEAVHPALNTGPAAFSCVPL